METRICSQCEIEKPLSKEYFHLYGSRGFHRRCKPCRNKYNKQTISETSKRKNSLRSKALRKHRIQSGMCVKCTKGELTSKDQCEQCYKKYIDKREAKKRQIFDAYGGCVCVCCQETNLEFLTLDHKEGGGNQHRKQLSNGKSRVSGSGFYNWIIKQNFPIGFQVLCMNCNFSLGKFGYCPHKENK
jgi:hypothetical protein